MLGEALGVGSDNGVTGSAAIHHFDIATGCFVGVQSVLCTKVIYSGRQ